MLKRRLMNSTVWLAVVVMVLSLVLPSVAVSLVKWMQRVDLYPDHGPPPPPSVGVELVGQIGGSTYAVAVQGDYAYIGAGPRLVILDISTPSSPSVVGQTDVLPEVVGGVAVDGDYAYVADGGGGLRIVDISDPASPTEAGYYDTPGYADGVAVVGDFTMVCVS